MPTVKIDEKYSPQDVQKALDLLEKAKVNKEKEKARLQNPEIKAKMKAAEARRQAGIKVLIAKAKAAGIVVSDKEVDDYLKANTKVK